MTRADPAGQPELLFLPRLRRRDRGAADPNRHRRPRRPRPDRAHLPRPRKCSRHLRQAEPPARARPRGLAGHGRCLDAGRGRRSRERPLALRPSPCCAAGSPPSPVSPATRATTTTIQTGMPSAIGADRDRERPPQPGRQRRHHRRRPEPHARDPGAMPVAEPPEPSASERERQAAGHQGCQRQPLHRHRRQPRPRRPGIATASGPNRTAACATTPAGSQSSASGQNP